MLYIVHVTFLRGCTIAPEDFFQRVNAKWRWLEPGGEGTGKEGYEKIK